MPESVKLKNRLTQSAPAWHDTMPPVGRELGSPAYERLAMLAESAFAAFQSWERARESTKGIYLTNAARMAIGLKEVDTPAKTSLTKDEIKDCQDAVDLDVTAAAIVKEWREDQKSNPLGGFVFTRHTPPFSTMDIPSLTPGNSRRQEAVSIYADIDGFTAYVADNINQNAENVVRVLHVLRAELERVLTTEFKGRRIRFIGDCVHGLICEGTAATAR